jgi:DGQHR domain-containing protein
VARSEIRLAALEVKQGGRALYTFAVDGKLLSSFTTVSRIHRDDEQALRGYQRSEAQGHIGAIKSYLETSNAILPNALVVAFDKRVRFKPADKRRRRKGPEARVGEIVIPIEEGQPNEEKAGWIVDGQQRSAALREADLEDFPVFVTAFITEQVDEQRSQFILVNSTKPLPKGLIHELLPETPAEDLPVGLLRRRYPALLLARLNFDQDSPLQSKIKTPTSPDGVIKDNSVLNMLAASLEDGALYDYFYSAQGGGDTEAMLQLLKAYWGAVEESFPEAWAGSARTSRLVHGVGIASMGALMDEIAFFLGEGTEVPSKAEFKRELAKVADSCAWTGGEWAFGTGGATGWNELQNTPTEIALLTAHLLGLYKPARGRKRVAEAA